jgi:hypothetical protein
MVIANIAYQNLTPDVKEKVDALTTSFKSEYPGTAGFIQIAVWPDQIRGQKIELFTHWHYSDNAFSADNTPVKNLMDTDNAVWAIKNLEPIVQNKKANPYERARFLAFLVHIVGDLHQPLHGVSRISSQYPDGDRGGNLFHLQYSSQGKSVKNLHSLWDGGVGLFFASDTPESISQLSNTIMAHYPKQFFAAQVNDLNPEDWANDDLQIAKTIVYNTAENQYPNTNYIETGRRTAEQRAALAGYRLAALLNQLLA